jgi:hypothetical protein
MGVFDFINKQKEEFRGKRQLSKQGIEVYNEPKEESYVSKELKAREKAERKEKVSAFFSKVKSKGVEFGSTAKESIKTKLKQARKNQKKGKTAGFLGGTGKSQSIFTGGSLSGKPNPIFTSGFGSSRSPFVNNSSAPYWLKSSTQRRVKRTKKRKAVLVYV